MLTVVLVVGLERGPGVVRSVFSWRPVVELGRISYGTYLWHWPVIVIVGRLGDFGAWQVAVLSVVVSTGLAAGSALLLELPLRESVTLDRVPRVVVAAGLSVSLLGGLVLVDRVPGWWPGSGGSGEGTEVASGVGDLVLARVPADFDQLAIYDERYSIPVGCSAEKAEVCTVVEGTGPHVVLVGDSNAVMLQGAMVEMARQQNLTLTVAALNGCPWEPDLMHTPSSPDKVEACRLGDRVFYEEILGGLHPDVVVAIDVRSAGTENDTVFTGSEAHQEKRDALASGVERVLASGAALVAIEPLPRTGGGFNPLSCLGTATYQEECRFKTPEQIYWLKEDLRALDATEERMWSVDLDRVVCPALPICDPIVDGTVVRWDGAHLTRRFGMTLVDDLTRMLADRGLLGG